MASKLAFAGIMGLGAGLMFLMDPAAGRRRRALMQDKLGRWVRRGGNRASAIAQLASDRARGAVAETRAALTEEKVEDPTLTARVRSELGRATSHIGAIQVEAHDGRVTLRGPVLRSEADAIVSAARGTRGVKDVEDRLERHDRPGNIPSLQGH